MKTELLIQKMDGPLTNSCGVSVLVASNLPWDLDSAFLFARWKTRIIMMALPTEDCRKDMLHSHLSEFSSAFHKEE